MFIRHYLDRFVDQPRKRRDFQSIRKSKQCISNTLHSARCRKRTAHTEKCWIHLAKYNNLRIKPSNVIGGGKGLFSWKRTIPLGSIISKDTGRSGQKLKLIKNTVTLWLNTLCVISGEYVLMQIIPQMLPHDSQTIVVAHLFRTMQKLKVKTFFV